MKRFAPFLAMLALAGCSRSGESAPEPAVAEIAVAEASQLFAAGEATPVDANSPATRREEGVVPGAVLLSSVGRYALSELPAEGTLVFYCANEFCTASDNAAKRAREAGREVAVMRAGIAGWKAAGQSTDPPSS